MTTCVPSTDQIASRLLPMRTRELRELAVRSGVPYRTLLKIRIGETPNPGLETVRKFFHLLPGELATPDPAPTATTDTQPAEMGAANA